MKVLIWTRAFAPSAGGIERYSRTLAAGLSAAGHEVAVCTMTSAPGGFDARFPFTVIRRPPLPRLATQMAAADVVHLCGPAIGPLRAALRTGRPIAIEHSGYQLVCPSGMLLRYPDEQICPNHFVTHAWHRCVRCLHDQGAAPGLHAPARIVAGLWRTRLCRDPAIRHVAVSRHVARRLGLPGITVIPHGIAPPAPVTDWRPAQLACISRLVREKGIDLLLQALPDVVAQHPDTQLRIIGDGPCRAALAGQVQALGLDDHVQFCGTVPPGRLDAALDGVATVVVPSRCEETFGLVALEQAARGRQVIASDIGGLGEVARAIDAALVPPGDTSALARAIADAIRRAQTATPRARLPRELTADHMVARHIALYREILRR